MTYSLLIGDRAYSSWSLRTWLLFEQFGIPVTLVRARLYSDDFAKKLADYPPARTVPTLAIEGGPVISETLAIAEELASRHPDLNLWPSAPTDRAIARMLASEMHAGFHALRNECPMNLRVAYSDFPVSEAVLADLHRLEEIWAYANHKRTVAGPWLLGNYSIADSFYAPVAARIATYGLPVSQAAAQYVRAHLESLAFRRWRAMSLVDGPDQKPYAMNFERREWPGPVPLRASHKSSGPSINQRCPYSGDEVADYLELDGAVYGFCNAFCRNKTVADPEAWPDFMALVSPKN